MAKQFWVRVPNHPDFNPAGHYQVRADLAGYGLPPVGEEFGARVLDWYGTLRFSLYTPVRIKLTGRAEEKLGSAIVWLAEVISGGYKANRPEPSGLFDKESPP